MSNAIDCSAMFGAVDPSEVRIDNVGGKYLVMHGTKLVWETDNQENAIAQKLSYCENGV